VFVVVGDRGGGECFLGEFYMKIFSKKKKSSRKSNKKSPKKLIKFQLSPKIPNFHFLIIK
jgi:hypothetical protein